MSGICREGGFERGYGVVGFGWGLRLRLVLL